MHATPQIWRSSSTGTVHKWKVIITQCVVAACAAADVTAWLHTLPETTWRTSVASAGFSIEYTHSSRTRRPISCVYWLPKSSTSATECCWNSASFGFCDACPLARPASTSVCPASVRPQAAASAITLARRLCTDQLARRSDLRYVTTRASPADGVDERSRRLWTEESSVQAAGCRCSCDFGLQ